jgi:EAL domain-containing protein (putative c-di-GMP-specific phosphodiesterase class I)/ActR/RegA family two-component response regulator
MADTHVLAAPGNKPKRSASPLCFIVDEDFAFRQDLAKELRREGIDTVEFSNSSRFIDMIDEQNPDIVLVNLNNAAPHECVRALLALKECRFAGAVQLFGHCEPKMLESFKTIGVDGALEMLPPLQKPIKVATIHNVIRERRLGSAPAPSSGISLKEALAKKMVRFSYQPKLDFKTALVVGAEAVARIAHPQLGLLTPDQFLKGADEEALLNLSRLALVDALRTSAHFHELGAGMQLAINISVDNLLKLPICDLVLMHRPECADWSGLLLEVPERQVINKIELLKARAPKLQQSGISIGVDNVGRGSSCLSVLNQIPFAEIKIDRSLVEGCASNPGNARICKTLIQMAHNFGCRAVAVGISAEADFQAMAQLDCDLAQGFLLGKPVSVPEIDALIASFRSVASSAGQAPRPIGA